MKRIALILIVIFSVLACTPNTINPQINGSDSQIAVTDTAQAFPKESTVAITPALAGTGMENAVEIVPTSTTTPSISTISPLPTSLSSDSFSSLIQFDVNGTYKDIIVDSIPPGGTKAFSINAMKGQVMSISTWRQDGTENYIPQIRIMGEDETTLCSNDNRQCTFWRGVLPSSQNYFVIFTADPNWEAASFMMRVAVNPPETDKQFFQYRNESTGISLTYNDMFAPTSGFLDGYITTGDYKIQPDLILHLIDTKTFENTNLSAVYMTIGSTKDTQLVGSCLDLNWNGLSEQAVGTEAINGYEFFHTKRGCVAAGHIGEEEMYRMVYYNTCYEIIFHIHSVDIGYLGTGTVVKYDRSAIIREVDDIFSSFKIE